MTYTTVTGDPATMAPISAEKILSLQPSDVRLSWGTSKPADGLRNCEIRLAREAAAASGFDRVVITYGSIPIPSLSRHFISRPLSNTLITLTRANIHPTTSHGNRRDKPHLTVRLSSSRYPRSEQINHINVHVWDNYFQQWIRYPSSRRPDNFPYQNVRQAGNIRFYRPLPRTLAEQEIAEERARRQHAAEQSRREEEQRRGSGSKGSKSPPQRTGGGSSSSGAAANAGGSSSSAAANAGGSSSSSAAQWPDGWYPDPSAASSGKAERWYGGGKWSQYTR